MVRVQPFLTGLMATCSAENMLVTIIPEFVWLTLRKMIKARWYRDELTLLRYDYEQIVHAVRHDDQRNDYSVIITEARLRSFNLSAWIGTELISGSSLSNAIESIKTTLYNSYVEDLYNRSVETKHLMYVQLLGDVHICSADFQHAILGRRVTCKHWLVSEETEFVGLAFKLESSINMLQQTNTESGHLNVAVELETGRSIIALLRKYGLDEISSAPCDRMFFSAAADFVLSQARALKSRPCKSAHGSFMQRVFRPSVASDSCSF